MQALTLVELLVILAIVAILASMIPAYFGGGKFHAMRLRCVDNLKQIGTAYRIWPTGQSDLFPADQTVALGGWRDLLTNANMGFLTWTNYSLISNKLGGNSKLVVCPADVRNPAKTFTELSNINVSYFVAVSASGEEPLSIAGGDRNLGPGNSPANDYGFSPANGMGNDIAVPVTTKTNPVCWSLKMHSGSDASGKGNILLGDGSVQQVTSYGFCQNWLPNSGLTNNWPYKAGQIGNWPAGFVPSSPSVRVLFP